ncbi:MAG: class I SAM-dependent methyltransferase, partial [Bacteroidota bacterium]|nr:class I SAM-dependent methyltransferase [Bacteroidota bacterium]
AETQAKEEFVRRWTQELSPATVWDLGSNTGRYARIAAESGAQTLAMDADDTVVDAMYDELNTAGATNITPLVMNLADPSPALGWAHEERPSLADRGPADLVLCLGLVHHLRYTHMLPLEKQLSFLARIARHVILEWIPPEDPNVRTLAVGSRATFPYSRDLLISAITPHFQLRETRVLGPSGREVLFLSRGGE